MTVTSSTTRAYNDAPAVICDDCDLPAEELVDCGTHTLCPDCLPDSPCSECKSLARARFDDQAAEWAYDAWRTREDQS